MKVMFDTNILLDVFQARQPHYEASAACLSQAVAGHIDGFIAAFVRFSFWLFPYSSTPAVRRFSRKRGPALEPAR